jgi:trk system potassium uptake protein TrkA
MKVAIAGAGKVGRSIARELLDNGHEVILLDKDPAVFRSATIEGAMTQVSDACEISSLEDAGIATCQVVVAATGDDKVNLVLSLLAKTEYGVPRVVARVNHPKNEWMFNDTWGVDVAVSTPRMLSALVEEAVSVGDLVRLFSFRQGGANLVEFTLAPDAPVLRQMVSDLTWPPDTALVAIVRGPRVLTPTSQEPLLAGDELIFVMNPEQEDALAHFLGHRESG